MLVVLMETYCNKVNFHIRPDLPKSSLLISPPKFVGVQANITSNKDFKKIKATILGIKNG